MTAHGSPSLYSTRWSIISYIMFYSASSYTNCLERILWSTISSMQLQVYSSLYLQTTSLTTVWRDKRMKRPGTMSQLTNTTPGTLCHQTFSGAFQDTQIIITPPSGHTRSFVEWTMHLGSHIKWRFASSWVFVHLYGSGPSTLGQELQTTLTPVNLTKRLVSTISNLELPTTYSSTVSSTHTLSAGCFSSST